MTIESSASGAAERIEALAVPEAKGGHDSMG
jgi:hypothetical protein